MLLDIDAAVFQSDDHMLVIQLLGLVAHGQHDWRPRLRPALAAERFVEGHALHVPALKELVQKSLEESISGGTAAGSGAVTVTKDELAPIFEDLKQPAVVVVEDAINEGKFLLTLAAAFGQHRIVKAVARHWLRMSHAGGKDRMARFVELERQHFQIVIRVAALLDSDRKLPEQRTRNQTQVERIRAVDGVAHVHMWSWCEIENYVPSRVWDHQFPDLATKITLLREMIPVQRGYLDIKRGLGPSGGSHLFRSLSPEARQAWRDGLPDRHDLAPGDVVLTKADFEELGPDAVTELEGLLAMINRIL